MTEAIIALLALTLMEIVLGIDNIVFITILTGRLPKQDRPKAWRIGLGLAMGMRIALLLTLKWIMGLENSIFELESLGVSPNWFFEASQSHDAQHWQERWHEISGISWRDIILLAGGLFLIGKSVHEIHHELEDHDSDSPKVNGEVSMTSVLIQIALLDLVFSLDSVITAVGMADQLWVMITAVVLSIGVMVSFASRIGEFVQRHPTLKMLALSFLILIGVMLVAEAVGTHVDKGYIYFAMAFALIVEFLNMRLRNLKKLQPQSV